MLNETLSVIFKHRVYLQRRYLLAIRCLRKQLRGLRREARFVSLRSACKMTRPPIKPRPQWPHITHDQGHLQSVEEVASEASNHPGARFVTPSFGFQVLGYVTYHVERPKYW